MLVDGKIMIGKGEAPVYLLPQMLNRHGLIAGATGTGKTVTLKVMAEGLSDLGVPVFLADIKGDVSGTAASGHDSEKMQERLKNIGIDPANFRYSAYPCRFWDVFGKGGTPVRATISEMGPLLLSRLLGLTDVQEGVLNIVFKIADDKGWKLIDWKDLKSMLTYVGEHNTEFTTTYGNVTTQSIGAIQRNLLALENSGAVEFFGEPELDINDWISTDKNGKGIINILHCAELFQQPLLYSTFMLWLLSELFEMLPEVGDLDKPKLVFFFDEAHLLFADAPKVLLDKIVQVVKLIRSKGVGIYFITQSPADIPDEVLEQLNNRVQHALRSYTPAEQKAVKTAAQSFRPNPNFKTEDVIGNLGIGCALVSFLDEKGTPSIVQQTIICPPQSSMSSIDDATRSKIMSEDPLNAKYKNTVDNQSAYEMLQEANEKEAQQAQVQDSAKEMQQRLKEELAQDKLKREQYKLEGRDSKGRTQLERTLESAASSTARSVGRNVGKQITRGVLGTGNNIVSNAAGTLLGSLLGGLFKR
jgi:DNA helicase HerA-like ATPase